MPQKNDLSGRHQGVGRSALGPNRDGAGARAFEVLSELDLWSRNEALMQGWSTHAPRK